MEQCIFKSWMCFWRVRMKRWFIQWGITCAQVLTHKVEMDKCMLFTACDFPFESWWSHSSDDSLQRVKVCLSDIWFHHIQHVLRHWDMLSVVIVSHSDIYRCTVRITVLFFVLFFLIKVGLPDLGRFRWKKYIRQHFTKNSNCHISPFWHLDIGHKAME